MTDLSLEPISLRFFTLYRLSIFMVGFSLFILLISSLASVLNTDAGFSELFKEPVQVLAIAENNQIHTELGSGWRFVGELPWENSSSLGKESFMPHRASYKLNKENGIVSISLLHRGIYETIDFGKSWQKRDNLLKRYIRYNMNEEREVTSIDSSGRFMLHKHNILMRSRNNQWTEIKTNLKKTEYLSATHSSRSHVFLGTSTNGLYRAKRNSKKLNFKSISKGLPFIPHNSNVKFYEEIGSIFLSPQKKLYIGTSIQGGLYLKNMNGTSFQKVDWPLPPQTGVDVYHITSDPSGRKLWISTSKGLFIRTSNKIDEKMEWIPMDKILQGAVPNSKLIFIQSKKTPSLYSWFFIDDKRSAEKEKRIERAGNKRLFYSSPLNWKEKLPAIKDIIKNSSFYNGLVLDVKDDQGYIRYDSKVEYIEKVGAIRKVYSLDKLVKLIKKYNRWLVARIVVFKDSVLFKNGYAILDKRTKKAWIGNPRERWIDPYHPRLAQRYYVPLIQELTALGVNEIQLDYIRFPSDGDIWNAHYSHKPNRDIYPSEALENFLRTIRAATHLPISLDIYGYNGLYRAPGLIGQDIDAYGRHADIIAPMLYSSHFGDHYMIRFPREERAFRLLYHSSLRYTHLARGRFLVRPWLQAFPMKNSIWGYGKDYFAAQIRGTQENGDPGFMFWGSISHVRHVASASGVVRKDQPTSGRLR